MILVDIGNTSIHFGVADKKRIRDFRIDTDKTSLNNIKKIVKTYPDRPIIVCSVVPRVTALFKKLKRKVRIVGRDITVPLASRYNKKQIGQDRLLNAYGARCLYPRSRLIIDFGTATTFDFITAKGEYAGGFIFPGIGLSYKSLSHCALLPDMVGPLSHRLADIPTNTCDSIHKGVREGTALMVNAWVRKYKPWITSGKSLRRGRIVITGGQAPYVLNALDFPFDYEPMLLFKGMLFLAD